MPDKTNSRHWPYGTNLARIRGDLSIERAARRVDVGRQTWYSWERGTTTPTRENLVRIVEAFQCPPELVGYTPPEGFALVPEQWLVDMCTNITKRLDALRETVEENCDTHCTTGHN